MLMVWRALFNWKVTTVNRFIILDSLLFKIPASRDKEFAVFEMASLVRQWPMFLGGTTKNLWDEYRNWGKFSTRLVDVRLDSPERWLTSTPSDVWFALLSLCHAGPKIDSYGLMFALGILAHRSDFDPGLVRALLVLATNSHSADFQLQRDYDLEPGHTLQLKEIRDIADENLLPFESHHLSLLTKLEGESKEALESRRRRVYDSTCDVECESISKLVFRMWPSSTVVWPDDMSTYSVIDLPIFQERVKDLFLFRFQNHLLFEHATRLQDMLNTVRRPEKIFPIPRPSVQMAPTATIPISRYVPITLLSLMKNRNPPTPSEGAFSEGNPQKNLQSRLQVLARLRGGEETDFLSRYAEDLTKCVDALEGRLSGNYVTLRPRTIPEEVLCHAGQWPSLGPGHLIRQLSFDLRGELSKDWLTFLVAYAENLIARQRQQRISTLSHLGLEAECVKEAQSCGGDGWNAMDYPDWLLIQLDANILIRPEQASIAIEMMSPASQTNAVMQLNMGEGKSSASLAVRAFKFSLILLFHRLLSRSYQQPWRTAGNSFASSF
jgi:hypothetical protein